MFLVTLVAVPKYARCSLCSTMLFLTQCAGRGVQSNEPERQLEMCQRFFEREKFGEVLTDSDPCLPIGRRSPEPRRQEKDVPRV